MKTAATGDTVKTITTHYIDGSFVESHGREVMNVIKPTNGQVIARVTLGDEEDTRRAIAAARRAFATFGRTTKEERAKILRRLHETASARIDELTAAMIEEYGGVAQFSRLIVESGVNAFAAAEKALDKIPWKRQWGKTTVTMEPVGVAGMITAWNAVHLPEAGIRRRRGLYGRHQAKRDELAAGTGVGRGSARSGPPEGSLERRHRPRHDRGRRART
jgi:hypothetical protein